MAIKIQNRRGSNTDWSQANPTLAAGEIGFDTTNKWFKVGDGSTAWNSLPYFLDIDSIDNKIDLGAQSPILVNPQPTGPGLTISFDQTANDTYNETKYVKLTGNSTASSTIVASASGNVPLTVKGAASQSVNLQEWKDNTPTTLASLSQAGKFTATSIVTPLINADGSDLTVGASGTDVTLAGTSLTVNSSSTTINSGIINMGDTSGGGQANILANNVTVNGTNLSVGDSNSTSSLNIGRSGITTAVQGPLSVNGATTITGTATVSNHIRTTAPSIKTANYTVTDTDNFIVFNGTANLTITLPTPGSTNIGRQITIKTIAAFTVVSASSNVKPLTSNTAGTAILAATAGKFATLVSDGTSWVIMAGN